MVSAGSSFSVPVGYYQNTTPYGLDQLEETGYGDFIEPDDFGEGIDFNEDGQNSTSDFNGEIVQAFNPYVKVNQIFFVNHLQSIFLTLSSQLFFGYFKFWNHLVQYFKSQSTLKIVLFGNAITWEIF